MCQGEPWKTYELEHFPEAQPETMTRDSETRSFPEDMLDFCVSLGHRNNIEQLNVAMYGVGVPSIHVILLL